MRWILILLLVGSAYADAKFGKQVRFAGIHPIPKSEGGGICYIEGPHVHIYAANKVEYRDHGRDHYFVGDPVAYGYDGPRFAYKGPHPVYVDALVGGDPDVEYCYLTGPHFHYFAPPDGPEFKQQGDAYFYVADPPQAFIDARPAYIGINETYRPLVYDRPHVEVEAPIGWVGARAEFAVPGVVVGVPGVVVGAPGVVVDHRGRVVEPGISAGIGVHVGVGVGIGVGVLGVVVHDRPVIIDEHGKHDNGRHEGWAQGAVDANVDDSVAARGVRQLGAIGNRRARGRDRDVEEGRTRRLRVRDRDVDDRQRLRERHGRQGRRDDHATS